MAAAGGVSSGSGFEVLTGDNYKRWRVLMTNYLKSKGLWDIISSDEDRQKAQNDENLERRNEDRQKTQNDENWERRNAEALYVIQLSCGPDYFNRISEMERASDAWRCLDNLGSPKLEVMDTGIADSTEHGRYRSAIFKYIWKRERDAVFECNSSSQTALHVAVIAGDEYSVGRLVNDLLSEDEGLLTMKDKNGYTALALVAQLNGSHRMARCMVEKNQDLLKRKTNYGQIQDQLTMETNDGQLQDLLTMETNDGQIPLVLSSARGYRRLTRYLYSQTPEDVLSKDNSSLALVLLLNCISGKVFDVALQLIKSRIWSATPIPLTVKDLPYKGYDPMPPLLVLANMPAAFPSGCPLHWWQSAIYRVLIVRPPYPCLAVPAGRATLEQEEDHEKTTPAVSSNWLRRVLMTKLDSVLREIPVIKEVYYTKLDHYLVDQILKHFRSRVFDMNETELREASAYDAMLQAAKYGIVEFIKSMSLVKPGLLWATGKDKRGVFSHVILNRQEKLKNLFIRVATHSTAIAAQQDVFGNNMLHQAAELGPFSDFDCRFGAVLQMQREIRWFKEVEKIAHPTCKEATNAKGKKPHEVFTESHKELVEAGEKWAKDAARSFTIVCTLIITITFAAAFTVPGGNNQETGFPIFLKRTLFEVFTMADTISLIASSSSVLISVVILTSRYTEQDFVTNLPLLLMANLFFLFMSVAAMMVAFCAGIAMMLRGSSSLVKAALSLASLPIIIFVPTQLTLFFQIAKSTIGLKGLTSILLLPHKVFIVVLIYPFLMSIYLIKKIKDCGYFCLIEAEFFYWKCREAANI